MLLFNFYIFNCLFEINNFVFISKSDNITLFGSNSFTHNPNIPVPDPSSKIHFPLKRGINF